MDADIDTSLRDRAWPTIGSLSNDDGNGNENVIRVIRELSRGETGSRPVSVT